MPVENITFHGFPALQLETKNGDKAVLCLYGAQVLSWFPSERSECLYLSETAIFSEGTAVRGGIPICFPQFGNLGNLPAHGFARTKLWRTIAQEDRGEDAFAALELTDNKETLALWPYNFRAILSVLLSDKTLKVSLEITNTGKSSFSFTTALHSYFRVANSSSMHIEGLVKHTYTDKVTEKDNLIESDEQLVITQETDRVYQNTLMPIALVTPDQSLKITGETMSDTVIWNPWIERSKTFKDFPDDDYRFMVCIETGQITTPITLRPRETWSGGQKIVLTT